MAAARLTWDIVRQLDINRVVWRQLAQLHLLIGANDVVGWADQAVELGRWRSEAQTPEWQHSGHDEFSATILSRSAFDGKDVKSVTESSGRPTCLDILDRIRPFRGGGVRVTRNSLRMSASSLPVVACAVATVSFGAACGGAGAATPTPTVVPSTAVSPVTVSSPQRPPLASPAASPAPTVTAASPTAASASADTSAGDTYEVQSGDTLLTVAQQSHS